MNDLFIRALSIDWNEVEKDAGQMNEEETVFEFEYRAGDQL